MASHAADVASASAWRTYLLSHRDVSDDDDRRTTLHRYVSNLYEAGENNPDALQSAGLLYLRKLDELGEERNEQLARYRALEEQTSDPLAARLIDEIAFDANSRRLRTNSRRPRKRNAA